LVPGVCFVAAFNRPCAPPPATAFARSRPRVTPPALDFEAVGLVVLDRVGAVTTGSVTTTSGQ
jgi:hypothetical protein